MIPFLIIIISMFLGFFIAYCSVFLACYDRRKPLKDNLNNDCVKTFKGLFIESKCLIFTKKPDKLKRYICLTDLEIHDIINYKYIGESAFRIKYKPLNLKHRKHINYIKRNFSINKF